MDTLSLAHLCRASVAVAPRWRSGTMSTRTILLTLHIAAIASWLGVDVLQHAMRHRWQKETSEATKAWARTQFWLHDRYYAVVAVVILVSGIALVQDGTWAWSSTFI